MAKSSYFIFIVGKILETKNALISFCFYFYAVFYARCVDQELRVSDKRL
jgi:hypothetical protein